jgi:hypothetical protein
MKLVLAGIVLGATLAAAAAPPAQAPPDPKYASRDAGPGTIDVSSYPDDQKKKYDLFAAKCSKCHPLARPVNSRFTAEEWKRYMKKMVRRPNSGINEEQAASIYDFLKFYSAKLGI